MTPNYMLFFMGRPMAEVSKWTVPIFPGTHPQANHYTSPAPIFPQANTNKRKRHTTASRPYGIATSPFPMAPRKPRPSTPATGPFRQKSSSPPDLRNWLLLLCSLYRSDEVFQSLVFRVKFSHLRRDLRSYFQIPDFNLQIPEQQ